ncbi:MAG: TraB/GumN family protein [Candidatus Woesearchaeota archaeon]
MLIFKNLTLVGTSHVAIESVRQAENIILSEKPKFVALELDRGRFMALMDEKAKKGISFRMIREVGIKGVIFGSLGAWVEKKIGKAVGVSPGSEMRMAAISAAKVNATIALIDRDIRVTIRHLFKYLTRKEKWRFFADIFKGVVLRKREVEEFDLSKVPPEELIEKLLAKTRKRYPGFYKALVEERNEHMAKNLYKLMNNHKEDKIIALIGAGHEKEMLRLIKAMEKKDGI